MNGPWRIGDDRLRSRRPGAVARPPEIRPCWAAVIAVVQGLQQARVTRRPPIFADCSRITSIAASEAWRTRCSAVPSHSERPVTISTGSSAIGTTSPGRTPPTLDNHRARGPADLDEACGCGCRHNSTRKASERRRGPPGPARAMASAIMASDFTPTPFTNRPTRRNLSGSGQILSNEIRIDVAEPTFSSFAQRQTRLTADCTARRSRPARGSRRRSTSRRRRSR